MCIFQDGGHFCREITIFTCELFVKVLIALLNLYKNNVFVLQIKGFKKENFDNYLSMSIEFSLIILLVTNKNNMIGIYGICI